jgi:hypothetical protein
MEIELLWDIDNIERYYENGGVVSIRWVLNGSDGNLYIKKYGDISLTPDPESPDFIPFEELTKETVILWVKSTLGEQSVRSHEEETINHIKSLYSPKIKSGLPWTSNIQSLMTDEEILNLELQKKLLEEEKIEIESEIILKLNSIGFTEKESLRILGM